MKSMKVAQVYIAVIVSIAAFHATASEVNTVPVGPAPSGGGGGSSAGPSNPPSGQGGSVSAPRRGGGNSRSGGSGGGGRGNVGGYAISPYITIPARPPMGSVEPYTPVEAGKLVEYSISTPLLDPVVARTTTESIVTKAARGQIGLPEGTVETNVVDVLDRGILVLDSYDEIKMRGVRMPSENDSEDVTRYYAGAAMDVLKQQTFNHTVFIKLADPARGSDGKLLADVFLADGTHLNKQILELGYGTFDSADFGISDRPVQMQAAEVRARDQKVGVFSKNILRGENEPK